MIRITHEGNKLVVYVKGRYPIDRWHWLCAWVCTSEPAAILLADKLSDQLTARIREIKHTAYQRGWDDAKKKRRKNPRKNFCGNWDTDQ